MNELDRDKVLERMLAYFVRKNGAQGKYACGYGALAAILTDEQIKMISRYVDLWEEN